MDARKPSLLVALLALLSLGATYKTPNFVVTAPSASFAKQVGDLAEKYRRDLAQEWLGYTLKTWWKPCPIQVRFARGAGGVTSFNFDRGHVFGWNMEIQGPRERILDSVLPHEVTHTIFASHFRRPLPRWADEGACSTVEHESERARQNRALLHYLNSGRSIRFSQLFRMKRYPRDIHPLYAEGHSLVTFMLERGGRRKFIQFLEDGMEQSNWTAAVNKHYGFDHLQRLQDAWVDWVAKGSRPLNLPTDDGELVAFNDASPRSKDSVDVVRAQSRDDASTQTGPLMPIRRRNADAAIDAPAARDDIAERREPSGWRTAGGVRTASAESEPELLVVPPTERSLAAHPPREVVDKDDAARLSQATRPLPPESAKPRVIHWQRQPDPPADPRAMRLSESGRAVKFDATPRVIRR